MGNDIVLIKLISGEEVVARVVQADAVSMVLSKPRVLTVQPTPDGQMGIMMIPLMVGIPDDKVTVFMDKIMCEATDQLPKQLEDGYLQQTSSIQLAGANGMGLNK